MKRFATAIAFAVSIGLFSTTQAQQPENFTTSSASEQLVPRQSQIREFRFFRRGFQPRRRFSSQAERMNYVYNELYTQRYPKFYGGFHASHFYNLGLPHGDNGFRGNGIYWAPW